MECRSRETNKLDYIIQGSHNFVMSCVVLWSSSVLPICRGIHPPDAVLDQEDNRIVRAREAQEKKRQKQQIDHLATQVKVSLACRI